MRPEALDQLDAMIGGRPPQAEVLDQGEVNAHLLQRGQRLAQDLDLGQVQPQDLVALGELDVIGQHPDVDPTLATVLETIAAGRDVNPHQPFADRVDAHRGHGHGFNETCTGSGPGKAPEPQQPDSLQGSRDGIGAAVEQGRIGHQRGGQSETADRNGKKVRPDGWVRDPLRDYSDEEWST